MENVIQLNEEFVIKYNNITHFCKIVFGDSFTYANIEISVLKTIKFLWWEKTFKSRIINDATMYGQESPIKRRLKYEQNNIVEICEIALEFYYALNGGINKEKLVVDLDK